MTLREASLRDVELTPEELDAASAAGVSAGMTVQVDQVTTTVRSADDSPGLLSGATLQRVVQAILARLSEGRPARGLPQPEGLQLLTAKPVLYVANIDEASLADGNALSAAVEARAREEGAACVRHPSQYGPRVSASKVR